MGWILLIACLCVFGIFVRNAWRHQAALEEKIETKIHLLQNLLDDAAECNPSCGDQIFLKRGTEPVGDRNLLVEYSNGLLKQEIVKVVLGPPWLLEEDERGVRVVRPGRADELLKFSELPHLAHRLMVEVERFEPAPRLRAVR
jgi:hypothetical protein